ncbi:MAG: SDR family NAD(P)-dependent oxidoreductase [Myxococcaceae bacterium]|nr:SDR family NAD(P)-dependent oxidoreductase [Myxococcaceae bacterium]
MNLSLTTSSPPRPRAQPGLAERYGPWAVVTGASDGIGREMARVLGSSGLNVVLVARRRERLEALAAELRGYGVDVKVEAADLGDLAELERVLTTCAGLDVGLLVASAGFGTSGSFLEQPLAAELTMLDVNCRAVVVMCHALGRQLAARGRGGLVLMSSLVAFQGVPRAAHYAATKAYVQSLAEGLHVELRPRGVEVLASAPGPIRSGFGARADMQMGMAESPEVVARGTLAALGRAGTVRPGLLSKLLELSLATLPRWARVRVMALVMGGMTRHRA